MATTIQTKPLSFQVAHVCSICGATIPHIQPKGCTLVWVDGKPQKIIKRFESRETQSRQWVDIVCVVARE